MSNLNPAAFEVGAVAEDAQTREQWRIAKHGRNGVSVLVSLRDGRTIERNSLNNPHYVAPRTGQLDFMDLLEVAS